MRQGGFDDSRENIFGTSRDSIFGGPLAPYPREDAVYSARSTLSLAYRVRSRWSVTFTMETGRSGQPSVEGYRGPFAARDFESPRAHIDAEQTIRTWGGLVSFLPTPGLRLGVGFAVNSVASAYTSQGLTLQRFEATRPGLVVDGGLELPARTRLFVDLGVQLRFVAPLDVGPVTVFDDGDYVGTVPGGSVSFSHSRVTIGLGLRL
jgi:hypothetical protein